MPLPELSLEEVVAQAYERRPDFLAAQERVKAAEAELRSARAGFLPSSDDEGRPCGVQSRDAELAARLARAPWALTDLHDDADGF